jgi:hypothetical protein
VDSEKEDGPDFRRLTPLITQDAEWDEAVHLPAFSTPVVSQGFAEEEA